MLHPPFLLGLIAGGAGDLLVHRREHAGGRSPGAYRAVEFIKRNMKLDGATKASIEDSKKVVRSARSTRRRACSTSS
jgi:K(+)-stimulated pyrophosphate-energized sodium pump